jgi:diadenosine tetraphosphate (Ap4A) HIT family hydrolase
MNSPNAIPDCPFCTQGEQRTIGSSRHGLAIEDRFPASRGHTLVVPRRHVESLFDLDSDVQEDLWALVNTTRGRLKDEHRPLGFTIGINDGAAAGQTVAHAHIHIIPRYEGDVADPRGGIRWVVPRRAAYWDR